MTLSCAVGLEINRLWLANCSKCIRATCDIINSSSDQLEIRLADCLDRGQPATPKTNAAQSQLAISDYRIDKSI